MIIKFSVLKHDRTVGKHFHLNPDLTNITVGNLIHADVETVSLSHIKELLPLLESMECNEHITAGINKKADKSICISGKVDESKGEINRNNNYLQFPNSGNASLMLIDSDNLSHFPEISLLKDYACVRSTSSSSNIYSVFGGELKGCNGTHTFYAVKDGKDIPRALKVLHQREVMQYKGNHQVSGSGSFLERSCVDTMLGSSSQPIYVKAFIGSGLEQRKIVEYVDGIDVIDTKKVIKDLTDTEMQLYHMAVEYGRTQLADKMSSQRDTWINERVEGGVPREQAINALENKVLEGDFILKCGRGEITVKEVLLHPEKYHGQTCRDPYEPDYGSKTVAKIYSNQAEPMINSNAHGGITYRLLDASSVGFGVPVPPILSNSVVLPPPSLVAYGSNACLGQFEWLPNQVNGKGVPYSTYANFTTLIDRYGIHIAYDVIAKEVLMNGPDIVTKGDLKDSSNYAHLYHLCKLNKFESSSIDIYMNRLMSMNEVNPVEQWIHQNEWDGVDRIDSLFNTLTLAPEQNRDIAYLMFRKWFIGACRIVQGEIDKFEFVLILQASEGGEGKTRWFNKLCPDPWQTDGVILDPADKDSTKNCISHFLVELGELDSSFRKSDVKKLMAFLSQSKDNIRMPYGKSHNKYRRRTAFFGSVNGKNFLADDSGDRRFWPMSVIKINYEHEINMQQFWAQINTLKDEHHWLNYDENKSVIDFNKEFKAIDPLDELLAAYFSRDIVPGSDGETIHKTATEILFAAGIEHPNKTQLNKCSTWMRKTRYEFKHTKKKNGFLIPKFSLN